jgi:tetratricopeptide (TPR) repeat protein
MSRFLRITAALALSAAAALGCASPKGGSPARTVDPEAEAWVLFMQGNLLQHDGKLEEAAQQYERAAELDPDSPELQRALAMIWIQLGKPEQALPHAERAHQLLPDDDEVRSGLATLYIRMQDFERAAALLEPLHARGGLSEEGTQALFGMYVKLGRIDAAEMVAAEMAQRWPEEIWPVLAMGAAYESVGRFADAEKSYRRALEIDPQEAAPYDYIARVRNAQGDRKGEFAVLQEKLVRFPGDERAMVRIAEIHEEEGRRDEAIAVLEKLTQAHAGMAPAQLRLGALYFESGRHAQAAQRFEAVARDAEAIGQAGLLDAALYFLGLSYAELERYDDAFGVLARVQEGSPRFAEALRVRAWILEKQGDLPGAIAEAKRALAATDDARRMGVFLAGLHQRNGDLASGVEVMNGLIEKYPDDVDLVYDLGVLHGEAEDQDRALGFMDQVLARKPDHYSALNYVGYTWAERGERLDEAESMIRRAIELKPDDGFITDSLGWLFYQRGLKQIAAGQGDAARASFQTAIQQLERALSQLDKADPVISWHLADAYRSVSRFQDALRSYEQALELDPKPEDAEKIRAQIELLRLQLGQVRARERGSAP